MIGFKKSIAIVLGINAYSNGIPSLRTCNNDASALSKLLGEHGYDVVLRIDQDVALAGLRQVLSDLSSLIGPDDRLLFYFAGHGVATDGDDGPVGYLIPQDARRNDVSSFMPMQELHDSLNALTCRHLLAILDCCFAGAFRWSSLRDLRPVPSVLHRERYDQFIRDPAWQVITSAAYDQKALDVLAGDPVGRRGNGQAHSPFARALIKGLEGEADLLPAGGDGVITATELYLYLRGEVELLVGSSNQRQTCGLWPLRKHDKGEYIFLSPKRELNLPPAPEITEASNPYRGLKPFEEKHKDLFFGRKDIVRRLHKAVFLQPLTVVVGASGTGKSSTVKAGLLPRLRCGDGKRWQILGPLRPGTSPVQALLRYLGVHDSPLSGYVQVADLATDKNAFARLVSAWCADNPRGKLLLIVDQLEEAITVCRSEQQRELFFALLAEALSEHENRLRVVVTVRADFEPQLLSAWPADCWQAARFILPSMTQDELREAIEGPASARVLYFKPPDLVDRLINEVVQMPGALPLLSFTLSEMYFSYLLRHADDRALTQADYEALGGVAGSLRRRATDEFARLQDLAEQDTMRQVMLRMVEVEGGEITRRRVRKSELKYVRSDDNARVSRIVEQLSSARLIIEGKELEGEPYLEPAHDVLVSAWDQLWSWIRADQDKLLLQRRLTQAADEWNDGKRVKGQLWDKDPRLPQLKVIRNTSPGWFNELETTFIDRSIRQRRIRLAQLIVLISTIFLILTGATVALYILRNRAVEQEKLANYRARIALSRQLAAQALNELPDGVDLALLLSIRANETADTLEARSSLLTTLEYSPHLAALVHGHTSPATSVAFSPDGRVLAAGGVDRTITLWNTSTRQLLAAPLKRHKTTVNCVAFSPNGQLLASGGSDGELYIWNANTLQPTGDALKLGSGGVGRLAFSVDSKLLAASYTRDNAIYLWDTSLNEQVTLPQNKSTADTEAIAFSPDGKLLAIGNSDGEIAFWDIRSRRSLSMRLIRPADKKEPSATSSKTLNSIMTDVSSLVFSPDSKILAAASGSSNAIILWDMSNPHVAGQPLEGHTGTVTDIAFSPDGKSLASASLDHTIILWDVATRKPLGEPLRGHSDSVYGVAFSPDGAMLASCGFRDKAVFLWDLHKRESLGITLAGHGAAIKSLAITPDAKLLASAGADHKLIIWDVAGWKPTAGSPLFISGEIDSLSFNNDGKLLAGSGLDSNDISVWKFNGNHTEQWQLSGHVKGVASVAFSSDGKTLASGSWDKTIRLWDVAARNTIGHPLTGHAGYVTSVAFSPDGKILASGSGIPVPSPNFLERTIILWDPKTQEPIAKPLTGHQGAINALTFDPSGRLIASGSDDRTVILWDVASRQRITAPLPHQAAVKSIAFSPDGNMLAAGCSDGTITIWDVKSLQPIGRPLKVESTLNSIAFDPSGNYLAAGVEDSSLTIWKIGLTDWLARAHRIANRDFTEPERNQYLLDVSVNPISN